MNDFVYIYIYVCVCKCVYIHIRFIYIDNLQIILRRFKLTQVLLDLEKGIY